MIGANYLARTREEAPNYRLNEEHTELREIAPSELNKQEDLAEGMEDLISLMLHVVDAQGKSEKN